MSRSTSRISRRTRSPKLPLCSIDEAMGRSDRELLHRGRHQDLPGRRGGLDARGDVHGDERSGCCRGAERAPVRPHEQQEARRAVQSHDRRAHPLGAERRAPGRHVAERTERLAGDFGPEGAELLAGGHGHLATPTHGRQAVLALLDLGERGGGEAPRPRIRCLVDGHLDAWARLRRRRRRRVQAAAQGPHPLDAGRGAEPARHAPRLTGRRVGSGVYLPQGDTRSAVGPAPSTGRTHQGRRAYPS